MHNHATTTFLIAITLSVFVTGCLPEDNHAPAPPELAFEQDILRAEITVPGTRSFPLKLANSGTVSVTFEVTSENSAWIEADPVAGELAVDADVEIQATLSCSAIGSFKGTVVVLGDDDQELDSVPIELDCVAAPEPEISDLDPTSFQLSAFVDAAAQSTLNFSNGGDETLTYQIDTQANWISVSPSQGSLATNESASIAITANCASTPETRAGTVLVRSNDADEGEKSANLELVCNGIPQPDITDLTPSSLTTQLQTGEQRRFSFGFGNSGDEELSYRVTTDSAWIQIASDETGIAQPGSVIEISATAGCGQTRETRSGSLFVDSNDPDEPRKRFAVSVECQIPSSPEISELSPDSLSLNAAVDGQVEARFAFSNEGNDTLSYSIETTANWITIAAPTSGSLDDGQERSVLLSASCGNATETRSSTVTVNSNDSDEASKSIALELSCGGAVNLALNRVYLNQATPSADSNRSEGRRVPVVADRPGLLRAFVSSSSESTSAEVTLFLRVDGGQERAIALTGPASVPTSVSESDIQGTFNTLLSASDVVSGLEFYVEVDPDNKINESDETDNRYPETGYASFDVRQPGVFKVRFVPIEWEGRLPENIDALEYLEDTKAMMPVGVIEADVRTSPLIADSDAEIPCDVLGDLSRLREADGLGDTTTHYYGIIKSGRGSGVIGCAFAPGYAGASLSISDLRRGGALETVAHELGHNLSLSHAPCGGPGGPDRNYPYDGAAIGIWGYNVFTGDTFNPNSNLKDLMSYCGPVWISDYHFDKALDYRDSRSSRAQRASTESRSLLVSGYVDAGQVTIETVVELDQPPSLPKSGEYEVAIFDETGTDAIRLSFDTTKADHTDRQFFSLRVPVPNNRIARLQILKKGQIVADRLSRARSMQKPDTVPVEVTKTATGRTRITWDKSGYESAVIRDGLNGLVVAFDQTGEVVFDATASEISVTLSDGLASYPFSFEVED